MYSSNVDRRPRSSSGRPPSRRGGGGGRVPRRFEGTTRRRDEEEEKPPARKLLMKHEGRDGDSGVVQTQSFESTSSGKKMSEVSSSGDGLTALSKSSLAQPMHAPFKLIDGFGHWTDLPPSFLMDQTDFLVVGVLGKQGSGKSTLMSSLAGIEGLFPPQSLESRERAVHETSGVDVYITRERVILLDCEPILSCSVLEYCGVDNDNTPAENLGECQSLQLTSFITAVCHVIIVCQDWFVDYNLLKFLLRGEMLKASTPHGHDAEEHYEYFPTVVLVQNRCQATNFNPDAMNKMQSLYHHFLQHSRLTFASGINMFRSGLLHKECETKCSAVNLFLIPDRNASSSTTPGCDECIDELVRQVLSSDRPALVKYHMLSERHWLTYAQKAWETVRKSSMIVEYAKLLY